MKLGWSERPGGRFGSVGRFGGRVGVVGRFNGRVEVVEGFCVRFNVVGGFGNESSRVAAESLICFRGGAECVAK